MRSRCRHSTKAAPRNERGVTLVLMALMMFLILGMSALAVDYGMIKAAKAEAQRAMDAAALAGASAFLVTDPAADESAIALERAKDYAVRHTVHNVVVDTALPPSGNLTVIVELGPHKVTAIYTGHGIPLWFANIFGTSTMAINALATAHTEDAGISTCLMPIAIRDKWNNHSPDLAEDANGDGILDYNDKNNNGQWDYNKSASLNEPWEQWIYDPTEGDAYSAPNTAYPTGYATTDYGRQMVMMQFDPNATPIASNYLAWGKDGTAASDSALRARILDPSCDETQLGDSYTVRAANGSMPNLGQAWDERIAREPSANWTWDASQNTVSCPGGCPANWEDISPRVVTIGLYDPAIVTNPQNNTITFLNFAKVFLDQRPCSGTPGQCKAEVTARFLGYARGVGGPGNETGPLNKRIVLIK
jgi:Flp pilus assembly protein TadG